MRTLALLLLLLPALPVAAQRLPQLDGLPLWHTPLREAPQEVREAIERHRAARAARLRPPRGGVDTAGWAREVMQPWLTQTRDAIQHVERTLGRTDAPPSWRLLGAVLVGDLSTHLATSVQSIPAPASIASEPELLDVYTRNLQSTSDPVAERAAQAFEVCASMAAAAPEPMNAWATRCRERSASIRTELASRTPPPPPSPPLRGTAEVPAACTPPASTTPPSMPPSDTSVPERIAVVYAGDRLTRPAEVERLVVAVERTLARRGLDLVPVAEARRARAQVAQRRWEARGPVCEVAPPIETLLVDRHPNLVLAYVRESCSLSECRLVVRFQRPDNRHHGALPATLEATTPRGTTNARELTAAARRLDEPQRRAMILGALGATGSLDILAGGSLAGIEAAIRRFHVAQVTPDDARLAPAARLASRERAFQTCFSGEGIVGMHVAAELDLHGAVRQAEVTLLEGVTGSERALETLRACLTRVVRETPFPCPAAEGTRVEANVCFQARQGAVRCVASGGLRR
ncbi:MAG: hypothetical protein H6720_12865 [Sandaracinus sp.]|nr:hypothetical protein [Sandaracinus sp.]